jgi:phage terminase large subunit
LFEPKRYKILWGGRGAGRSWGVSRALLIKGTSDPIRVLCARELQNSIAESVHKILSDQITALGLDSFYEVQAQRILGKNGTSFAFEGIKNNVNKIKSYEGIDVCWVEEANKVSRNSWGVLIPTIRKEDSEIWLTFNPELETDYTYRRFVVEADPASMYVVKMTWRDNPWFPEVLREEMERDKKLDYDHFLNIWEGHCVQVLEGAIYAKELRRAQEENRICSVPYDREYPVETFWDLGRGDATSIWFAQRVAMQFRILDYFTATGEGDVGYYLREMQGREYVYGTVWLPHDARAKRLGTKRTIQEQISQMGYKVRIVPNISRTDGINATRMIFPNCWFDETRCQDGLQSLRHYRYRVIDGQYSNEPVHDWASDGADAFRYLALALRERRDSDGAIGVMERLRGLVAAARQEREEELEFSGRPGRARWGGSGWMR